jgi:hypothetical protein
VDDCNGIPFLLRAPLFFYNIRLFVYRAKKFPAVRRVRLAGGSWLVLICSERKVLLADCWWLVCFERKVLLAGG